jgi:hypothetical protein
MNLGNLGIVRPPAAGNGHCSLVAFTLFTALYSSYSLPTVLFTHCPLLAARGVSTGKTIPFRALDHQYSMHRQDQRVEQRTLVE